MIGLFPAHLSKPQGPLFLNILQVGAVQGEWDEEKEPEGFHLVGTVPTAQKTGLVNGWSLHILLPCAAFS